MLITASPECDVREGDGNGVGSSSDSCELWTPTDSARFRYELANKAVPTADLHFEMNKDTRALSRSNIECVGMEIVVVRIQELIQLRHSCRVNLA